MAEKAALATGPISSFSSSRLLSLAGWELEWRGWRAGAGEGGWGGAGECLGRE